MRPTAIDLRDVRIAGGAMLAIATIAPLVTSHARIPCPLRAFTGVPCPLCGMTTSVTAAVHLEPAAAFAANPAGLVAVVVAIVLLLRPRWTTAYLPGWAPAVALGAMWLFELRRFGTI